MHRFFVDKKNILEDKGFIYIDNQEDVKHISRVLRLKEGVDLEICDGANMEYLCKIDSIEKTKVNLTIVERLPSDTEPSIEVTLFQGIPKSTKMELIIQKCTELGIIKIVPIINERTIVQLKDRKAEEKKVERWQKIGNEAAKQCKRGVIPKIHMPLTFDEMLTTMGDYDLAIILYENEENNGIKAILQHSTSIKRVAIIIGPEGGFEKKEIEASKKAAVIPVSLGPRILRTETAGLVALSIVMYEIGDLGGN